MRLTRLEKRWMLTVFDAILPPGELPGARDLPLDRFLDAVLQRAPFRFALGLRAALWMVLLCPLLVIGRPRTFLGLSVVDRERVLTRLGQSRLYAVRELPNLLKMVACLGWGSHPEVRRRIGLAAASDRPPAWVP